MSRRAQSLPDFSVDFGTSHANAMHIINQEVLRRVFLDGSVIKNLPAVQKMQETWVQSLGREDPLEEKMATHSSVLALRIPGMGELGGLRSMGLHRVRHD